MIFIPVGNFKLEGELVIPSGAESLVIFSHGSGSSRFSPRNNFVANELHKKNIGTFLLDLLTKEEDELFINRFNIKLLTERLILATGYIKKLPKTSELTLGFFGASTGAASALYAAVAMPRDIKSVVSRGGRTDLAINIAADVKAPTLLIVGERDYEVLEMNKEVYNKLTCDKKFEVIAGATHLFEEHGALEKVATLAADWFRIHLQSKKEKEITIN